jgi:hypothetical protein
LDEMRASWVCYHLEDRSAEGEAYGQQVLLPANLEGPEVLEDHVGQAQGQDQD